MPKGFIKSYKTITNKKFFYEQPIDSDIKWYKEIRKLTTGQGEDYPKGCLLDYKYIKSNYKLPSRQILVSRASRGRSPPTSPGRLLKILFDRPGDVLIWHSRDLLRTFSGRPLEDLQSTQIRMYQIFFNFSFRTYSTDQIYLKAFQHSICIDGAISEKLVNDFLAVNYFCERSSS